MTSFMVFGIQIIASFLLFLTVYYFISAYNPGLRKDPLSESFDNKNQNESGVPMDEASRIINLEERKSGNENKTNSYIIGRLLFEWRKNGGNDYVSYDKYETFEGFNITTEEGFDESEDEKDNETEIFHQEFDPALVDGDITKPQKDELNFFVIKSNFNKLKIKLHQQNYCCGVRYDSFRLWNNKQVPIAISSRYRKNARISIRKALQEVEDNTCIRFIPAEINIHYRPDYDYVRIKPSNFLPSASCESDVGRQGGPQDLVLNFPACKRKGIILHEIMHTLGFFHEHNRPDRDDYIIIKWDKIKKNFRGQFRKVKINKLTRLGTPYDFASVMHYHELMWSVDGTTPTIIPKNKKDKILPNANSLSYYDILDINRLYNCEESNEPN